MEYGWLKCREDHSCKGGCGAVWCDLRTPEECAGKYIIRNELTKKYWVFPSVNALLRYRNSLKDGERCLHEVIPGGVPQKFRVDVDNVPTVWDDGATMEVIAYISGTIQDLLMTIYNDCITKHIRIVVTESKGFRHGKQKRGYHLITKRLAVASNYEVSRITDALRKELMLVERQDAYIKHFKRGCSHSERGILRKLLSGCSFHEMLDDVSKESQSLRLIGCHKLGDEKRVKMIMSGARKDKYAVITYTECCDLLPQRYFKPETTKAIARHTTVGDDTLWVRSEELMTVDEKNGFTRRTQVNVSYDVIINYDRAAPAYCKKCDRVHDSDHSLYFIWNSEKDKVYKKCRRFKPS